SILIHLNDFINLKKEDFLRRQKINMIEGELRHGLEFSFFDLDEMDVKVFCRSRKLTFLGCCESWTYMNAKWCSTFGVADRPEHVSINFKRESINFYKKSRDFKMPRSTSGFSGQPGHVSINYRIPLSTFVTLSQLVPCDDQLWTGVNQL